MPGLFRDEFNAYRKSMLQDYLYEMLFKEDESSSTASTSLSLMEMPSLSIGDKEDQIDLNLQEIEQHMEELLNEVKYF